MLLSVSDKIEPFFHLVTKKLKRSKSWQIRNHQLFFISCTLTQETFNYNLLNLTTCPRCFIDFLVKLKIICPC